LTFAALLAEGRRLIEAKSAERKAVQAAKDHLATVESNLRELRDAIAAAEAAGQGRDATRGPDAGKRLAQLDAEAEALRKRLPALEREANTARQKVSSAEAELRRGVVEKVRALAARLYSDLEARRRGVVAKFTDAAPQSVPAPPPGGGPGKSGRCRGWRVSEGRRA
jgi:hypothetical protein